MTKTTQRVLIGVLAFLVIFWILRFLMHLAYSLLSFGALALIVVLAVGWWLERRRNGR